MSQFSQFGLSTPILKALEAEGYTTPTPIQAKSIPDVLAGRDLLGIAQTGTGKTAAFALPMLQRLTDAASQRQRKRCRALVLSPTRELASQIADSFRTYGRNLKLTTTVIFGGVPIPRQERTMAEGVDVLVATPGRLLDLVDRRTLDLGGVEILVLDEADQMLDLGFIHALRRIVTLLPKKRQTLFFSATMPKAIESLAAQFINDPVRVAVTPVATTAERVDQSVMFVSTGHKPALLKSVLSDPAIDRTLVFTRTKHGADRVVRQLDASGIAAAAIHGNKSQGQRERALAEFRAGTCRVLVATDIAARGIDVDGVSHVVNFDLPNVPESYVHRIGRTARAGAAGTAISFCNDEERAYLRDIERLTRLKVPVMPLPEGLAAMAAALPQPTVPAAQPQGRNGQGQGRGRTGGGGENRRAGGGGGNGPSRQGRGERRPGGPGHPAGEGRGPARQDRPRGDAPRSAEKPRQESGGRSERPRSESGRSSDGQLAWLDRARGGSR